MFLKKAMDLSKSIDDYRHNMNELIKNKGNFHPEVLKVSHQLDEEIIVLREVIDEIRVPQI